MIDQQIRGHIDAIAPPLNLDEITASSSAVNTERPAAGEAVVLDLVAPIRSRNRQRWARLTAIGVAAAAVVVGLIVANRPDTETRVPLNSVPITDSRALQDEAAKRRQADQAAQLAEQDRKFEEAARADRARLPTTSPSVVPLVETAITGVPSVAKPGSVHVFSVQGHPDVLLWTALMPNLLTGKVEEWQCVSEANGSGCGSTSMPAQSGQTSSIDNHVATDDLFTWSNLPAEVDHVLYDDGVVKQWQRPIAGLVIFRVDPDHPHPTISAFDASGAPLPYSFWGQNPQFSPATTDGTVSVQPATTATSGEILGELQTLTQSSTYDCLTMNGATWPMANVPSFPADLDSAAIWNACVVEVKSIVAARQAELNKGQ